MNQDDLGRQSGDLSLDACLELLASRRRRVVLGFFLDSDVDQTPVDELISEIITEEARATGERPDYGSVAATLFHIHLPKLEDAGVLDYDTRHLDVRYHGDPRIEELYATIQEVEEDASRVGSDR